MANKKITELTELTTPGVSDVLPIVDKSGSAETKQVTLANLTQGKQATITGAATTIDTEDLTSSRALESNASGKVAVSAVTSTELGKLAGLTATTDELNTLDGITSTTVELNLLDGVTATTGELNILDGVTSTAAELNILDGVTSTAAELNILDGVTSTAAELNILDGVTSTAAELNILDGVTSTAAELNILDGVTSTAAELNLLDGVTATTAELNYVDGVTSNIQTQLDAGGGVVDATTVAAAGALMDSECTDLAAVKATEDPFTAALLSKLNAIEASADVTDATNVTSAGAVMDSELTDLAGVKGVTISTLQVKPSEGAFVDGDKTKLDAVEASADVTDATNVTAAGALMDSECAGLAALKLTTGTFLTADQTKLDGIETSADVTDATNVAAAGAVMDSEVTNLAFVKALTKGISDGNVLTANDVVADDDFLRISGTEVEGLTDSEMLTAIGAAASSHSHSYAAQGANGDITSMTALSDGGIPLAKVQDANKTEICLACSDETTALTTGTAKLTFRMPHAMTLTEVRASVTTAPVGSTIIVDINDGGTTIMAVTKLSIDASEKTSTTAAAAAVLSDTALADDAEVTVDIDQVGSSTEGAGLKIWLIGYR